MRKALLLIILTLCIHTINSQNKPDRNGNLIGHMQKSDLTTSSFKKWFEPN